MIPKPLVTSPAADAGKCQIIQYPQLVLLGDSLFQQSADVRNGFSFQGALQNREHPWFLDPAPAD